jgi:hypothetical protein
MGTPAIKIVHNKFKNVPKDVQAVIWIINHTFIFILQTLNAISTEQSSTIVFPFPIDTLCLNMGIDKEKRKCD